VVVVVDDVDDTTRRTHETEPDHEHRVDRGDLAVGLDPHAGAALHAPVHYRLSRLLEAPATVADAGCRTGVAVSVGQRAAGGPDLRVGQRQFSELVQIHRFTVPPRA
jgi:hypothetical protein